MRRIEISPRPNWQNTIEQQGFLFNEGDSYWKENTAYSFTEAEILTIEKATNDIFSMCCEAVEYVIKREWYDRFCIDRKYAELIRTGEWIWLTTTAPSNCSNLMPTRPLHCSNLLLYNGIG